MFTEQGPFRPLQNLSLRVQPYSWVNIANMIFIEAPGISLLIVSYDNYHALLAFFKVHNMIFL